MGNIKWSVPRKNIVISKPLCNREFKKLREWLDKHEWLEISTDSKQRIWIFNNTRIEKHKATN